MDIFHVNKAGDPGRCRALLGQCPFGGAESHYIDKDDARKAFELSQEELFDAEYAERSLAITTQELRIIDSELLSRAILLSKAKNGTERDLIEAKTTPIAIIRAVRVEEHSFALNGAINNASHVLATEENLFS